MPLRGPRWSACGPSQSALSRLFSDHRYRGAIVNAAELQETKDRIEANYTVRYDVERLENWRGVIDEMPFLTFPKGWEIQVIPPFAGAVARFVVRKGEARVSVYADFYERLGCWAEPHWEIYPDADDNNARFSIATETERMLEAIGKSLAKQLRVAKREQVSA
jgi:hypothetical protein